MSPKVSIIIPTYNSEQFLDRTIKSVVNQTFKDWELIIVDDFSTDNTREII
ncbi:MAG: glycosyltransferase family 2 protein, partial [Minisyncoccia bacterium]